MNSKSSFYLFFVLILLIVALNLNAVTFFIQSAFVTNFTNSICDQPIYYKIGSIDPRFNISTYKFLENTETASQIWSNTYSKNPLFIYDPARPTAITINLIYDNRASLNKQITTLKSQLKQKDQSLQSQIETHRQQVTEFKKKLTDYNAQIESLNQEITAWNEKGGAPPDEFQKLKQRKEDLETQQAALQSEAESLNQTAKQLNVSTENYNLSIRKLNTTIDTFTEALTQKPEEGLYDPQNNTIDIYLHKNQNELIHTLTHEMGHALGLPHNNNQESIMFPFSTESLTPTAEDINALTEVCKQRRIVVPFFGEYIVSINQQV